MTSEIVMPRMGLTMEAGKVVNWLKEEGQAVQAGEPLLEIETDKATVEIEALESGVLAKIIAGPGQEMPVGATIGLLLTKGETMDQFAPTTTPGSKGASLPAMPSSAAPGSQDVPSSVGQKVKASPAARRLANSLEIDLAQIKGTGPDGRVVAWNVAEDASTLSRPLATEASEQRQGLGRVSPIAKRVAADLGVDPTLVKGSGPSASITRKDVELAAQNSAGIASRYENAVDDHDIEPVSRIQRLMAERMSQSFGTAPHFYLHVEVDVRQMVALRLQLSQRFEQRNDIHLTFTDLLTYFCARVLPDHPLVMAEWKPEGLKKSGHVNIGIAMETNHGLMVPVVRDADKLGLVEIARQRKDLARRAEVGKLLPNEFEAGVFTLTNLGMYGIDAFDAILNPPQAAILAVGRIKERALVENGQLIAAATINLSLSVDHRVLDGAQAARFLNELAEMIEIPGLSMA